MPLLLTDSRAARRTVRASSVALGGLMGLCGSLSLLHYGWHLSTTVPEFWWSALTGVGLVFVLTGLAAWPPPDRTSDVTPPPRTAMAAPPCTGRIDFPHVGRPSTWGPHRRNRLV